MTLPCPICEEYGEFKPFTIKETGQSVLFCDECCTCVEAENPKSVVDLYQVAKKLGIERCTLLLPDSDGPES